MASPLAGGEVKGDRQLIPKEMLGNTSMARGNTSPPSYYFFPFLTVQMPFHCPKIHLKGDNGVRAEGWKFEPSEFQPK